ncbi:MAG: Peptidyl-prolyl isomerase cwc27, partial [Pleopsidium flavum]
MFGRVVGDTIYNLMKMGEAELVGEGSERPLYPAKVTGTEILVNPFEDMVRREIKARPAVESRRELKKKPTKKAGKALLSFGGDEGDETELSPVVKKAKFNPKLVSVDGTSNGAFDDHDPAPKSKLNKAAKSLRQYPSKSPSPPQQPDPNTQLPIRNAELPSRSPSTSPVPAALGRVSSLLDKTNAQIAELKASMKRTIATAPADSTRQKSTLEQMIPEGSTRGRKRKYGANGNMGDDKEAISILNEFRAKLDRAPPESRPPASPVGVLQSDQNEKAAVNDNGINNSTPTNTNTNANAEDNDDEGEVHLCDLHFIANCQSCQAWDKRAFNGGADPEDDDDRGWMAHALSFEKDRLGKDLTWKRKNEEELVVIDPREK